MKYISAEIDSILDLKHLEQVFLVNNMADKRIMWDIARNSSIDPPEVIHGNFATTLIEKARALSSYESPPVPVHK